MTKRPAKPLPARPQLPVADVASLKRDYYALGEVIRALFTGPETDATKKALAEHRARADRMWETLKAARAAKHG